MSKWCSVVHHIESTHLYGKHYFAHTMGGPFLLMLWTWKLFLVNLNMGHWTEPFYKIKQMVTRLRLASSILLYLLNGSLCQTSIPSTRLRKLVVTMECNSGQLEKLLRCIFSHHFNLHLFVGRIPLCVGWVNISFA